MKAKELQNSSYLASGGVGEAIDPDERGVANGG